jgi:hypothetical protein
MTVSSDRYRLYVHCLGIVWSLGMDRNARLAQNFESVPGWIQINFIIWDSECIFCLSCSIECRVSIWHQLWADNLHIWQQIIWHCCQNDHLFQNKWPKRPTHATYALDTWSSILQFVHYLFWLKLKWNARSKLFYFIIYRSSMLCWSSRTLTKLKSQSQNRFNERKYQYLKYKNKNHSRQDT